MSKFALTPPTEAQRAKIITGLTERRTRRSARARHRSRILRRVPRQSQERRLHVPFLRLAALQIERQVRFRYRLAQLLRAVRRSAHPPGARYQLWNDPRRRSVRALRKPSGTHFPRRPCAHRRAALPELRLVELAIRLLLNFGVLFIAGPFTTARSMLNRSSGGSRRRRSGSRTGNAVSGLTTRLTRFPALPAHDIVSMVWMPFARLRRKLHIGKVSDAH